MTKKRKEVDRLPMGILVMGGGNFPPCAYQMYRIRYDDGTSEVERGLTLHSLPGISEPGKKLRADVRPDLLDHMRAMLILQEPLSNALYDLDNPKPKKRRNMGNNQAYSFMEETVMGAYKMGRLDKKLLAVLLEPYRDTDIDFGGSADLKAKDGLEVPDIVIKIMDPATFKKLEPLRVAVNKHRKKDYNKLTEEQQDAQEEYYEKRYEAFHKITKKQFGWC